LAITAKGPLIFPLERCYQAINLGEFLMAGTKNGGKAAATTNKTKYGADFYARIGAIGGKKGHTGGFAANRELARVAGAKGGRISRRTKKA
jgi:general stress protein YciG